ncbi:MAG TPA: 30S ribosomal protein S6 [Acidimicrobiales bacterium]|nr:30S ribosomal protein S6 [Acidimicrobiales bacterium]
MRPYEVVVIVDASLDDEVIRATIARATSTITGNGGSVGRVDRWGKRRFAYEVAHKSEGYYAVIEMTAEPATVAELDRTLGLADEVVRHKVIRLPEKAAGRAPRTVSSEAVEAPTATQGA